MVPGVMGSMARAGGGGGGGSAMAPETLAYIGAMSVPPNSSRANFINDLIVGLKTDGIFERLDNLFLLASHDIQAAKVNVILPTDMLLVRNSPTFTIDKGLIGQSANNHWYTARGVNFTGSKHKYRDKMYGAYFNTVGFINELPIATLDGYDCYFFNSSNTEQIYVIHDNDNATAGSYISTSWLGLMTSRGLPSGYTIMRNGVSFYNTSSIGSSATTAQFTLGGNHAYAGNYRMAAFVSGGALDDAGMVKLSTRIQTYMTAIGANY